MIRQASAADLSALGEIGALFHIEAGLSDIAGYVREDCEKSIRHMIEAEEGICLVAEEDGEVVGVAGGLAHPLYFNHGHLSGMELFWWVRPDHRTGLGSRLFSALEDAARALGCVSWAMIALDKVNPAVTGRIYERRGYRASEHTYIKRL